MPFSSWWSEARCKILIRMKMTSARKRDPSTRLSRFRISALARDTQFLYRDFLNSLTHMLMMWSLHMRITRSNWKSMCSTRQRGHIARKSIFNRCFLLSTSRYLTYTKSSFQGSSGQIGRLKNTKNRRKWDKKFPTLARSALGCSSLATGMKTEAC